MRRLTSTVGADGSIFCQTLDVMSVKFCGVSIETAMTPEGLRDLAKQLNEQAIRIETRGGR